MYACVDNEINTLNFENEIEYYELMCRSSSRFLIVTPMR